MSGFSLVGESVAEIFDNTFNSRYSQVSEATALGMHNLFSESLGQRSSGGNAEKCLWEQKMRRGKSYSPRNERR
jgi:hypothetical protein